MQLLLANDKINGVIGTYTWQIISKTEHKTYIMDQVKSVCVCGGGHYGCFVVYIKFSV